VQYIRQLGRQIDPVEARNFSFIVRDIACAGGLLQN
jgi:hypothetical protein